MHRLWATGEDDAARSKSTNRCIIHIKGMQLAIHANLAHAAGDQLAVLGAEVEDQDTVGMNIGVGHGHLS